MVSALARQLPVAYPPLVFDRLSRPCAIVLRPKWVEIATRLPGRTEHAARNRYHRLTSRNGGGGGSGVEAAVGFAAMAGAAGGPPPMLLPGEQ